MKLELVSCKKDRKPTVKRVRNPALPPNPTVRVIMRENGYVTPNEAAFLCGFTVQKIYHLMHGGRLEYCECGGLRFVLRTGLLRCFKAPPIQQRIREAELPPLR